MEFQSYVSWISSPVQIAFLDLVLGADNAIIIALVCRTLPSYQRLNVMIVGTGAALLMRVVLTALTGTLMALPMLRIAGGFVLMLIAISMTDEAGFLPKIAERTDDGTPRDRQADSEAFWDAILLVALADGIMSLDNTVALAAVAKGQVLYLFLGLAVSVPMLVFGSWLLAEVLVETPLLARLAMAVLGWIAGDMAVSDPLVAGWIDAQAPALVYAVPIAVVVFVLTKGAARPIVAPAGVIGPLDMVDLFSEGPDERSPSRPEAIPEAAPVEPEPVAAVSPLPAIVDEPPPVEPVQDVALVADPDVGAVSSEVTAIEPETQGDLPQEPRPGMSPLVERIILWGFIGLFTIAGLLIVIAIYFGSRTA